MIHPHLTPEERDLLKYFVWSVQSSNPNRMGVHYRINFRCYYQELAAPKGYGRIYINKSSFKNYPIKRLI